MTFPHPQTRPESGLPANFNWQAIVRGPAASHSNHGRSVFQITFKLSHIMNTFDPSAVRKAVAEFTPLRPQKFEDLISAKEVIIELRQKRASYRSIADLLSQHFL